CFFFLQPNLLVRLESPFLRPDQQHPNAVAGRGCQGWPSLKYLLMIRAARPHLDSSEHDSTLVVVGMTRSRGARLWRTNNRAATLYSVGRNDPDHDAVLRIGSEAPRRRAHSAQRHESHGFRGTPPPRTVIGDPLSWCGSSRNRQAILATYIQ